MTKNEKNLTVKDWFANKVANELQRNIEQCDVFAIMKETEKAVYAMLSVGVRQRKTMWVPKSVLVESEHNNLGTWKISDYNEASDWFEKQWDMYD